MALDDSRGFGWLAGITLLIGLIMLVGFLVFSRAVYAFGFFGAFLLLSVALLIYGWMYDRRQDKKYPAEE